MSGILGVWNLDGRPLDPLVLARMSESLRHRGLDGEGRKVLGSIGLVHQHLWVTPEEHGENQPLVGRAGAMLAMDGRLDNRDELLGKLDLPLSTSDAACVLAAYEKWDAGFAERLNGDFALAVFDPPRHRLLLVRDAIGIRPLYYFNAGHVFLFASEIKALLLHKAVRTRQDDEGLADFLLIGQRPVDRQDVTCFAGISALVPAHLALVTPEGVVSRRYWDFDTGRSLRLHSFDEYVEAFRERFTEAVRRRIRSARPVAVSLSGGLDSSSIFCQAETLRRAGNGTSARLCGISHIGTEGTQADEQRYLMDIERDYDIVVERFPMEPLMGVTDGAEEQIRAIEAPFADYMWGVTRELRRRAAAAGARTLLSGHWGDEVLFSSAYLIDLFNRFAWPEVRRHTREYERWFGTEGARVLRRRFALDLARHHLPRALVPPLKWIRRKLFSPARAKPWLSEGFLEKALRFANRPATLGAGFHSAQARSLYLEARSKYHVQCMEWNNKIAALHGLDAAFPFLDRDLLAFLMAVPGDVQNRGGAPRALLREAMRGVLPDALRARTWKADFSDVVNRGVAKDARVISATLSGAPLAVRLGYLDPVRLSDAVARLSANLQGSTCLDSWDLTDLFALEVWLRVFDSYMVG